VIAGREGAVARKEAEAGLDELSRGGGRVPAEGEVCLNLMGALDGDDVVEFSEGNSMTRKETFQSFLVARPPVGDFSELPEGAPLDPEPGPGEDEADALTRKARGLMKAAADRGEDLDFAEAIHQAQEDS